LSVQRAAPPPAPQPDWAYFLDVDGTLIDVADTPDAAHVDAGLLDLIARLHRASGGAVALISGRALADLQPRLGKLRLPLAGQHGLERRDAAGKLHLQRTPSAGKRAIKAALAPVLARHPGLLLEDKGLALALHYRRAPHLAAYAQRLMARLAVGAELELQRGKRVAELKPAGVDKGTAVTAYLAEAPFKGRRPVFIGDDLSDENAFAVVNRLGGVSIKVGRGASCARCRLRDVAAARAWLMAALKVEN
jgi:trehalose 6-phosphate phosphatase